MGKNVCSLFVLSLIGRRKFYFRRANCYHGYLDSSAFLGNCQSVKETNWCHHCLLFSLYRRGRNIRLTAFWSSTRVNWSGIRHLMPCIEWEEQEKHFTVPLSGSYQHWTRFKGFEIQAKCSFLHNQRSQPGMESLARTGLHDRKKWSSQSNSLRQYLRNDTRLKGDDEKYDKSHGKIILMTWNVLPPYQSDFNFTLSFLVWCQGQIFQKLSSSLTCHDALCHVKCFPKHLESDKTNNWQNWFNISPVSMVEYYVSKLFQYLLTFLLSVQLSFQLVILSRGVTLPWLDWMVVVLFCWSEKRGLYQHGVLVACLPSAQLTEMCLYCFGCSRWTVVPLGFLQNGSNLWRSWLKRRTKNEPRLLCA